MCSKIFGAFIAALVAVVAAFIVASAPGFVAALGTVGSKVVAGTVGGMIGGALGGAITGGHMGALMGLTFGAVGGALAGLGSAGLSEIGVETFWGQFAVMSGVGAALSGGLGGWEGLVTFGAGSLGALAGVGITGGIRAPPHAGASASAEAQDELTLYADLPTDGSGIDYILRNEIGGGGGFGRGGGFGKSTVGKTTVIGRVKDLKNIKTGEQSLLDRLLNKGSPQENWKQNSSVLRQDMTRGQPIRDGSPGDTGGKFLNAERNLLKNHNWKFDQKTNYWMPPE